MYWREDDVGREDREEEVIRREEEVSDPVCSCRRLLWMLKQKKIISVLNTITKMRTVIT